MDLPAPALLFALAGSVSLVTPQDAHPPLHVGMLGMLGREGVLSPHLLLWVAASPVTVSVQQGVVA